MEMNVVEDTPPPPSRPSPNRALGPMSSKFQVKDRRGHRGFEGSLYPDHKTSKIKSVRFHPYEAQESGRSGYNLAHLHLRRPRPTKGPVETPIDLSKSSTTQYNCHNLPPPPTPLAKSGSKLLIKMDQQQPGRNNDNGPYSGEHGHGPYGIPPGDPPPPPHYHDAQHHQYAQAYYTTNSTTATHYLNSTHELLLPHPPPHRSSSGIHHPHQYVHQPFGPPRQRQPPYLDEFSIIHPYLASGFVDRSPLYFNNSTLLHSQQPQPQPHQSHQFYGNGRETSQNLSCETSRSCSPLNVESSSPKLPGPSSSSRPTMDDRGQERLLKIQDGKICRVCSAKALGNNFNAVTCESCKAFFRRNALRTKELLCSFNCTCDVNKNTRRFCPKCRLTKCFSIGMKKEWIMTDAEKKLKKDKIELNRLKRQNSEASHHSTKSTCLNDKQTDGLSSSGSPAQNMTHRHDPYKSNGFEKSRAPESQSVEHMEVPQEDPRSMVYKYESSQRLLSRDVMPPLGLLTTATTRSPPKGHVGTIRGVGTHLGNSSWTTSSDLRGSSSSSIGSNSMNISPYWRDPQASSSRSTTKIPKHSTTITSQQLSPYARSSQSLMMGHWSGSRSKPYVSTISTCSSVLHSYESPIHYHNSPSSTRTSLSPISLHSPSQSSPSTSVPTIDSGYQSPKENSFVFPGGSMSSRQASPQKAKDKDGNDDGAGSEGPDQEIPNPTSSSCIIESGCKELIPVRGPPPPLPLSLTLNLNPINPIVNVGITSEYNACAGGWDPTLGSLSSNSPRLNPLELHKLSELIKAVQTLYEPLDTVFGPMSIADIADPSLLDVINLTEFAIKRLIEMSKEISGFKNICREDQIALLKGGCVELMILRSVISYDPRRDAWIVPYTKPLSIPIEIMKEAREDLYEEHSQFLHSFKLEWRTNENIITILCAISLFTPTRLHVIYPEVIKLEQDFYYYLLRRYLESIYPNSDEAHSAYHGLIKIIAELHHLHKNHLGVFLNLSPVDVKPFLVELFDLTVKLK